VSGRAGVRQCAPPADLHAPEHFHRLDRRHVQLLQEAAQHVAQVQEAEDLLEGRIGLERVGRLGAAGRRRDHGRRQDAVAGEHLRIAHARLSNRPACAPAAGALRNGRRAARAPATAGAGGAHRQRLLDSGRVPEHHHALVLLQHRAQLRRHQQVPHTAVVHWHALGRPRARVLGRCGLLPARPVAVPLVPGCPGPVVLFFFVTPWTPEALSSALGTVQSHKHADISPHVCTSALGPFALPQQQAIVQRQGRTQAGGWHFALSHRLSVGE
jgi:hypothetical protein